MSVTKRYKSCQWLTYEGKVMRTEMNISLILLQILYYETGPGSFLKNEIIVLINYSADKL